MNRLYIIIHLMLTMTSLSCCQESADLQNLLQYHYRQYPQMTFEDVYKLLYQGTMGNVHFIDNQEAARAYLYKEFTYIKPDSSLPRTEPVSLDGSMIRLNLAPYKAQGGEIAPLFTAMLRTADEFNPSLSALQDILNKTQQLADNHSIPLDPQAFSTLLAEIDSLKYPAIHHSDIYKSTYHPSYRVILKKHLPQLE